MDPKETSVYHICLITLSVIVGFTLFYIVFAIRFRSRLRRAFYADFEAEINKIEAERARIAQDLHDGISPVITAIKMKLETVTSPIPKNAQTLSNCIGHLDDLTIHIRQIATGLMPSVLRDKGLIIAVEQYIHNLPSVKGLTIKYEYEYVPDMPEKMALQCYRIIQEIIHNTIKHANAGILTICIANEKGRIVIATADNGTGFRKNTDLQTSKGNGLSGIRNRLESLNGQLKIKSNGEYGTSFYITIPLI